MPTRAERWSPTLRSVWSRGSFRFERTASDRSDPTGELRPSPCRDVSKRRVVAAGGRVSLLGNAVPGLMPPGRCASEVPRVPVSARLRESESALRSDVRISREVGADCACRPAWSPLEPREGEASRCTECDCRSPPRDGEASRDKLPRPPESRDEPLPLLSAAPTPFTIGGIARRNANRSGGTFMMHTTTAPFVDSKEKCKRLFQKSGDAAASQTQAHNRCRIDGLLLAPHSWSPLFDWFLCRQTCAAERLGTPKDMSGSCHSCASRAASLDEGALC